MKTILELSLLKNKSDEKKYYIRIFDTISV
jgi:hypothetical protein